MFEALAFLMLFAMLHRLHRMHHTLKRTEAKMSEINDALQAFRDDAVPKIDAIIALNTAAAADILKIHELLTGSQPDVPAALAIIEELRGKFTSVEASAAELRAAVDIPEPGDEPPTPPVEG